MDIYNPIKTCSKCNQTRYISCFGIDNNRKDGRQRYCKECVSIYRAQHYKENKSKIKEYNQNNRHIRRNYDRNKTKTDPLYKLRNNIRVSLIQGLKRKGYTKQSKTHDILGCDYNTLKEHLESKFKPEMNWDNHGIYWDIDHIIPMASAKTEDDIIRLNHYTNLQPLESYYNRHIKRGNIL